MNRYLFFIMLICLGCKHDNPKKWVVLDSLKQRYSNREIHILFDKPKPKSDTTKDFYIYFSKELAERVCKMSKDSAYRVSILEYNVKRNSDFVYIESFNKKGKTTNNGFIPYYYVKEFSEVIKYDE